MYNLCKRSARRQPIALAWALRMLSDAHFRAEEKPLWRREILAAAHSEVRHYLHQLHRDYKSRGRGVVGNRNGSNNRRWRRYLRERRPRVWTCGSIFEIIGRKEQNNANL